MKLVSFDWKWFFKQLYERSLETDIFNRAAQIAFYFVFSLFPFLFFLVSLFGLILGTADDLRRELFAYFGRILPGPAYDLVRTTVNEIAGGSTGGKLALSLAVTLWSASAGVDSIRTALNAVYGLRERRWWWKIKLQSLVLTLLVITLVALVLAIVFYGWQLAQLAIGSLGFHITSPWVLVTVQWAALLLVMLFACEVIYNLLPDFESPRWVWITSGSVVAIILWILLTTGFRLYLEYFDTYNRTYGSLGAVIILLLWLYLTGVALLVGGVINAVVAEAKHEPVPGESETEK